MTHDSSRDGPASIGRGQEDPSTDRTNRGNSASESAPAADKFPATRHFRQAVEQSASAVFVTDRDGTIKYVNPTFEDLTGYEADEALGRTPRILQSGRLSAEYYERMWQTILEGEVWREEIPNRRADGELYYAHQTIAPMESEDGEITGFVAVQNDVTDRKRVDDQRRMYEKILHQLEDPVMVQDRTGAFVMVNDAVSEYAGMPREELLGRDEFAFMDEEAATEIAARKREVLEREEVVSYEVSLSFGNENEYTFSTLRYPHYDDEGTLTGTFAICRDFTERRHRERELEQYKCAVEGAYDLIAACDTDEQLLFANQPYCELHGINPDAVSGLAIADVLSEADYEEIRDPLDSALAGKRVRYRMIRTDPERGERILDVRYYPIHDSEDQAGGDPEVIGAVAIIRDVTEEAERNRHLQVVDRILRHNIRNELNVIHGRAARIRETSEDKQVTADAEAVLEPAERLLETAEKSRAITEILRDHTRQEETDIAAGCRSAAEWLRNRYPDVEIDVTAPETAVTVASKNLGEAIDELLENAVVHAGDETRVEVRVTVAAAAVHVSIRDWNAPISKMDQKILEEGRTPGQLSHGSGLGLWLVYWIVKRSGGSVTVRELDPTGNVVTVELPRERSDTRSPRVDPSDR